MATCLAIAACGGDDDGSASADPPAAPAAAADTFRARAAQACAEAINARDAQFTDGRDAMLDAVVALRSGGAPSADTVDVAAVQAVADQLDDTGEALRAVDRSGATDAESAAWDDVIADVDERHAWIAGRVTALEAGDRAAIEAAFTTIEPVAVDEVAIATLGFDGLDCARVLEQDGPADDFTRAAATACSRAAQQLRDPDVEAARVAAVTIVASVAAGDVVEGGDAAAAADEADTVATAHRSAADTLAEVDAPDDRSDAWGDLIDALEANADVAQARADALRDGDQAAIADAFAAGAGITDPDVTADAVTSLGLDQRDCAAVG